MFFVEPVNDEVENEEPDPSVRADDNDEPSYMLVTTYYTWFAWVGNEYTFGHLSTPGTCCAM